MVCICCHFGFAALQQDVLTEAGWTVFAVCHRCIAATNKALAKRRAAEDALRIIAQKELQWQLLLSPSKLQSCRQL